MNRFRQPDDECTVVTLGIGRDIGAETALRNMTSTKCQFFGADPIVDGNKELYEKIGKYYEMAVGAKSGIATASVLGCKLLR